MRQFVFFLCSLFFTHGTVYGQIFDYHGDLSFLSGQDTINVVFNYDSMMVFGQPEAAYIKSEKAARDAIEGEGAGKYWHEEWIEARENIYHPLFLEILNKTAKRAEFGHFPDAEYTMEFKVTRLDPPQLQMMERFFAEMDAVLNFKPTSSSKILAYITVDKIPGTLFMSYNFEQSSRIKECYGITAKRLGPYLKKRLK